MFKVLLPRQRRSDHRDLASSTLARADCRLAPPDLTLVLYGLDLESAVKQYAFLGRCLSAVAKTGHRRRAGLDREAAGRGRVR